MKFIAFILIGMHVCVLYVCKQNVSNVNFLRPLIERLKYMNKKNETS
jgi:hypothetical protein